MSPDVFSTRLNVASSRANDGTGKYRLGRLAMDGVMQLLGLRPRPSHMLRADLKVVLRRSDVVGGTRRESMIEIKCFRSTLAKPRVAQPHR